MNLTFPSTLRTRRVPPPTVTLLSLSLSLLLSGCGSDGSGASSASAESTTDSEGGSESDTSTEESGSEETGSGGETGDGDDWPIPCPSEALTLELFTALMVPYEGSYVLQLDSCSSISADPLWLPGTDYSLNFDAEPHVSVDTESFTYVFGAASVLGLSCDEGFLSGFAFDALEGAIYTVVIDEDGLSGLQYTDPEVDCTLTGSPAPGDG